MSIMIKGEVAGLRITALLVLLIFAPLSVFAEPVWSGNASVDESEFVNFADDFPLAGASSSFSRNTKVTVTNPQNDKSVEITIVKRAPRPGVFLVLSAAAAQAIDMPEDQVIPVQVQVSTEGGSDEYAEFNSADPDINPAVSVPAEESAEVAAVEETVAADDESGLDAGATAFDGAAELFADEPLPVPMPGDSLRVDRSEEPSVEETVEDAAEEEIPLIAEVPEEDETEDLPELFTPEEIAPEVAVADEPVVEEELVVEDLPTGENVIYFLTPSDFRPPTGPATVKKKNKEEIVPVLVDRDTLEGYIVENLKNGSSYIQLGAYGTADSIYSEIEAIDAKYPMVVWTDYKGEQSIYKLLIGPLTRDETGVLTYRFRDSGYADLFLYKP